MHVSHWLVGATERFDAARCTIRHFAEKEQRLRHIGTLPFCHPSLSAGVTA